MARNEHKLTDKQQVFCDLYRASEAPEIRGNAKKCYMLAYGCEAKSAEHNGPRLLKDKNVDAFLNMRRAEVMKKFNITEESLLQEVACAAYLDPDDFYGDDGELLAIPDMPEHARRALEGIEVSDITMGSGDKQVVIGHTKKVKYSKKEAQRLLMQNMGMLKTDIKLPEGVGGVMLFPADAKSAEEWRQQHYQQPDQKGK